MILRDFPTLLKNIVTSCVHVHVLGVHTIQQLFVCVHCGVSVHPVVHRSIGALQC